MRRARLFIGLLFGELLVIGAVVMTFRSVTGRLQAGIIAGSIFATLGLVILFLGSRKTWFRRSATFWAGLIHLFVSSLPLLVTRVLNASSAFEDVRVLGLPGPVFHQLSTGIYLILLTATIWDGFRFWREERSLVRG